MIICRSCHSAWPDTALYCGKCKRSFGGRRCPKGHLSPRGSTYCLTCGSKDMSVPADSVSFGLASKVIAWCLAVVLLKVCWPVLGIIAALLLGVCDWLFGLIVGVRASDLFWQLFCLLLNLAVLTGIFALMIPGFRRNLPSISRFGWKLARAVWKLGYPALRLAFRALKSLIQGVHHETKKPKDRPGPRALGS